MFYWNKQIFILFHFGSCKYVTTSALEDFQHLEKKKRLCTSAIKLKDLLCFGIFDIFILNIQL